MEPTLSIVVPFYKVEDYLEECLASLAAQSLTDLQIVMVDDGSPDGSAVIAKTFAARDPRFVLVQQENQGLGPARNTGVRHATGRYLAFADSDDMVPPHAYERMVGSLEETGSDLVSGGVQLFNSQRAVRAKFLGDAFRSTRTRTHISRDPELLHDRVAWNKVFRRSFWDEHDFAFPAGAYEDAPVTIPAHVHAAQVDVLRDVVYHYRQRESGEPSITQRRTELSNLEDRLASIGSVSAFLGRTAPDLKEPYDLTTLDNDLMIFINVVESGDDGYRARLCALAGQYLEGVDPALLDRLTSIKRLKYHLARQGRVDDLIAVREYERTGLPAGRIQARGLLRRRWYAGHPFRGDAGRAIPDAVYDVTGELRLRSQIDAITWVGDTLRLSGHAYVPGLDMTLDDRIEVWLQHTKTRRKHRLRVRRAAKPSITANSGQPAACYDGAGFSVDIDPARLRNVPGWKNSDWRLHAAVRVGSGRGRLRLDALVTDCGAAAQWPRHRHLFDDVRVQAVAADQEGVSVRFRRPTAQVTDIRPDGDALAITGWVAGQTTPQDEAVLSCRERGTGTTRPVSYGPARNDRVPFLVRLPLTDLTAPEPEQDPDDAGTQDSAARVRWDLSLRVRGKTLRLSVADGFTESVHGAAGKGVVVTRTRYGNLTLTQGPPQLLVTELRWASDGHLVVAGEYAGGPAARPSRLVLRRRRSDAQHTFPLTWGDLGDGARFEVRLPVGAITSLAGTLPLAAGKWELLAGDGNATRTEVTAARACLAELPGGQTVAAHQYRVWPSRGGEGLHINARVARPADQRGPYAQRLLRERDYPAFRRRPVRDLVVFESYFGWQYSCNPKAIYEEFRRRDTGHELVWVQGDRHFHLPDEGRTVQRHSREYYEVTAEASIVVNNVAQPTCYVGRPGQTYLQTWHGTPVKSIGFDMDWSQAERRDQRLRELAADVSRWDLLVSQNPFSTEIMRRAFGYQGEVLESGYPRNDLAHHPDRDRVRAAVRDRLGIPEGKRAVLFAPTWRDHLQTSSHGLSRHRLGIDLGRARSALGQDTVLLLRRHHLLNAPIPPGYEDFVTDVTAYPDIAELYLAADALVTDYSSAMCDFAAFGKPILLFTPDLQDYRDSIRGFTFDLTERRPGPLLPTSDDLVDALASLDTVAAENSGRLAEFARTFSPLDDGRAAARVVDRLLNG